MGARRRARELQPFPGPRARRAARRAYPRGVSEAAIPAESSAEQPFAGRGGLARCARCALHLRLCLCAELEPLALRTRVLVLSHRRERHKPTNSARLLPLMLRNAELRVVGLPEDRAHYRELGAQGQRALLLYPSPRSRELAPSDASDALTLIAPDGNWRQARKLATREPELAALPHVHLPPGPPSRYRLRHHGDARFLATFEAVARALGILEGAAVEAALLRVFELMVERTLYARGSLSAGELRGGLPAPLRPSA